MKIADQDDQVSVQPDRGRGPVAGGQRDGEAAEIVRELDREDRKERQIADHRITGLFVPRRAAPRDAASPPRYQRGPRRRDIKAVRVAPGRASTVRHSTDEASRCSARAAATRAARWWAMKRDDPIERLAREGRALESEETAATQRRRSAEGRTKARETRRLIENSVSRYGRWGWIVLAIVLGMVASTAVVALAPASWHHPGSDGDPATGLAAIAALLPAALLAALRPWFGRRAVARERSWAAGLPFRLVGYPDELGGRMEGTARLTIRFAPGVTDAPDDDTLGAVFRTINGRLAKNPGGAGRQIEYEVGGGDSSYSTSAHLAAFVHRAVAILLALHAKHAIEEVRLRGFE
jgi:hypothetical protein